MDRWRAVLDGEPTYYNKRGDCITAEEFMAPVAILQTKSPLVFVVGCSGSGKDAIVDAACNMAEPNLRKVVSYTTRPKRNGETTTHHRFISSSEFDRLQEYMLAKTTYNGYRYGALLSDVDKCDFYIIDPNGFASIDFTHFTRPYKVVQIVAEESTRVRRMRQRGDSERMIAQRIKHDREVFDVPFTTGAHVEIIENNDDSDMALDACAIELLMIHGVMPMFVV